MKRYYLHAIKYAFAVALFTPSVIRSCLAQDQTPPPKPNSQSTTQNQSDANNGSKPLPQVSKDARYDFQGEATFIIQSLGKFHSAYEGRNSFRTRNEMELTDTYEMFIGARLASNLEVYIDPEIAWGSGLSSGMGLAAYTNGDVIGQPTLRPYPYLSRYFVRWRVPMRHLTPHKGGEDTETEITGRAPNIIAGKIPAHRLVIQAGKFAISDVFDLNSYANDPRIQFINKAFNNNLTYDFAQETRGSDVGGTISWINPNYAVRFGTFAMPTSAGGPDLAYNLNNDHSEQIEVELHPQLLRSPKPPLVVRLLGYRNVADMGSYSDALTAALPGMSPDVSMVTHPGAVKYGFGINFEQPLADGGDTGVFGRLGWNNGSTESFASAEADQSVSLGGQLSGSHWHRKNDRVGLAVAQSGIYADHQNYLANGGLGLSLGDGALRYGPERVVETYYSYQVKKQLTLSLDYQFIDNPGYNRDRGPASVVSVRAHVTF